MDTTRENPESMNPGKRDIATKLELNEELFQSIPFELRGMLTPESKHLLTLPSQQREGGVLLNLIIELEDMEFFHSFSNDTKRQLAKVMQYSALEADQVLLKQTQKPPAMFVIASGVVCLRYNIESGSHDHWPEMVLRRGDVFGQHDLLRKRPSTVDAYTVGYTEVLSLKAEDFPIVESVLEHDINQLYQYLRSISVLSKFGWTDSEYQVLETFSMLRKYLEEVEIYDGSEGTKPRYSHFVVSGECRLVRYLHYTVAEQRPGVKLYKAVADPGGLKKSLVFETVRQGFYFGVGEDFERNCVLATPATECLMVPRLVLVLKDRGLLSKMREDLVESLPSDQFVLDNFSEHELAVKETEDLLGDIFKEKPHRLRVSRESNQKPRFVKYV